MRRNTPCCDGLTGFADAIEAVWPHTVVQTCVVHLIRNTIRFISWKDRKAITKAIKPIYQAATADTAATALDNFETEWGDKYPAWRPRTPEARPDRQPMVRRDFM